MLLDEWLQIRLICLNGGRGYFNCIWRKVRIPEHPQTDELIGQRPE